MNPLLYLKAAIYAAVLLVGLGIGYKIGDWSGEKARATLQAAVVKGNLANQDLQTLSQILKDDNQKLSSSFASQQALNDAQVKVSETKWNTLLGQKTSELQALQTASNLVKNDVKNLEAQLAKTTDTKARADIQARIDADNKQVQSNDAGELGLQCLSVVVPDGYLALVNGNVVTTH